MFASFFQDGQLILEAIFLTTHWTKKQHTSDINEYLDAYICKSEHPCCRFRFHYLIDFPFSVSKKIQLLNFCMRSSESMFIFPCLRWWETQEGSDLLDVYFCLTRRSHCSFLYWLNSQLCLSIFKFKVIL